MSTIGRASMLLAMTSFVACATANDDEHDASTPEGIGEPCQSDEDCAGGLPCTDDVCCNSECAGTCQACDVPGSLGTCTPIPAGEDPAEECGAIGCDGYYWGWAGSICYAGSQVSAGQAACDGAGACRPAAEECALANPGTPQVGCDELCQAPQAETCVGTEDGVCVNVDQGTDTCGVGACEVTMSRCTDGVPTPCQPNNDASGPEVCNGADDDCDGMVDDDWAEPNEQCLDYTELIGIVSGQFQDYTDLSLYPSGDEDYYRIVAVDSGSCACGSENFQLLVYLAVPAGAGSHLICAGTSCGSVDGQCQEVLGGQNREVALAFTGSCGVTETFEVFVHIRALGQPYLCEPYLLSYELWKVCA